MFNLIDTYLAWSANQTKLVADKLLKCKLNGGWIIIGIAIFLIFLVAVFLLTYINNCARWLTDAIARSVKKIWNESKPKI